MRQSRASDESDQTVCVCNNDPLVPYQRIEKDDRIVVRLPFVTGRLRQKMLVPPFRAEFDRHLVAVRSDRERPTGDRGFNTDQETSRLREAVGVAPRQAAPLRKYGE